MAVDAAVLGVDAIGQATGIGTFDYHPISTYGKSIEATGSDTTTALVTMVNGFADEWSDAIERPKHGDYRGVTDVSVDTLLLIDGARSGGVIALDKAEVVAAKLGNVAKTARAVVQSAYTSAAAVPAEVRNIAAAMADGADAFVARLRAGGMQMATAGGEGGPGPNLGGLSAETLAEAAQAAKEAFKDKRLAQQAPEHAEKKTPNQGASIGSDPTAEQRLADLARDPDRGGATSAASQAEAEVALGLEAAGELPAPVRRPKRGDGHSGDFVDGSGQDWDVKAFRSREALLESIREKARTEHRPEPRLDLTRPIRGEFMVEAAMKEIRGELKVGENVMIDTRHMNAGDIQALRKAIANAGLDTRVKFFPR